MLQAPKVLLMLQLSFKSYNCVFEVKKLIFCLPLLFQNQEKPQQSVGAEIFTFGIDYNVYTSSSFSEPGI